MGHSWEMGRVVMGNNWGKNVVILKQETIICRERIRGIGWTNNRNWGILRGRMERGKILVFVLAIIVITLTGTMDQHSEKILK